jgi:hypothetical protein
MSTRLAKQIIYGAFYAIVLFAIFFGGYLLLRPQAPVSCEVTGDCVPVAQPITVLAVEPFTTAPGHTTFLAKIANPNTELAAWNFSYSFNVYDASGTLLQTLPGDSYLYGGEIKYVLLTNQTIATSAAATDLLIPTSTVSWVATSSFGLEPQLAIINVSTAMSSSTFPSSPTVIAAGQLIDNDTASFNNIFIVAVFKDASGNPIGASQTELNSIAPNQTESFSISYPDLPGINPAATEVEAYAHR